MKYQHLRQIAQFLSDSVHRISRIRRVADMVILIEFDRFAPLCFDLSKQESAIYKAPKDIAVREYKAPFDAMLFKRFSGASVCGICCEEGNRILKISAKLSSSYKALKSELVLEFTGRFTNAIIIDENNTVLAALRHIDNSQRKISPSLSFTPLAPREIKEREVARIDDFWRYFEDEFIRINSKALEELRGIKIAAVQKKIDTLNASLNALPKQAELEEKSTKAASLASLILANLNNIPEYAKQVCLSDFNGNSVKISLQKPAKQEANALFEDSKRLRAKAAGVRLEEENLTQKIIFNQNLLTLIKSASSISELEILYPRKATARRAPKQKSENIKDFYVGDVKISVGRNEKGNSELLKQARKNDIWMHVKDLPSAHVLLKTPKMAVSDEVLELGARLCVSFSSLKSGRYEVDYTRRENVKIQNGSNVKYINFKTIIVKI